MEFQKASRPSSSHSSSLLQRRCATGSERCAMGSSLFFGTLSLSAPLILASMGGYTSERSGVINIALEGNMLVAACAGYFATYVTHNSWLGFLIAIVAATLMSLT